MPSYTVAIRTLQTSLENVKQQIAAGQDRARGLEAAIATLSGENDVAASSPSPLGSRGGIVATAILDALAKTGPKGATAKRIAAALRSEGIKPAPSSVPAALSRMRRRAQVVSLGSGGGNALIFGLPPKEG